jgi:hypothetical protein
MEPLVDKQINHWISKLETDFAATAKKFDFAAWATYEVLPA